MSNSTAYTPTNYISNLAGDHHNDDLYGALYDDYIAGHDGDDTLRGDAGDDVLHGGQGSDTLNGGYGDDTYVYSLGDLIGGGVDLIHDVNGADTLQFGDDVDANLISAKIDSTSPTDVTFFYDGTAFLTIEGQFANQNYGVETLKFGDVSVSLTEYVQDVRDALPDTEQADLNEFGHNWGGIDEMMYRGEGYEATVSKDAGVDSDSAVTLTIATGTSVAEILDMIADIPTDQPLIVHFESGEHVFTEQLRIERGDIRIEGDSDGSTTFIARFAEGETGDLIHIKSPDTTESGHWRKWLSEEISSVAEEFSYGDQSLTLNDVSGLEAGDVISISNTVFSWKNPNDVAQTSFVKIESINGNTLNLAHKIAFDSDNRPDTESLADIKVFKIDLLENVEVRDFSIQYDIDIADGYNEHYLENNNGAYAQDSKHGGELSFNNASAVRIAGTYGAKIDNITVENAGSNGVSLYAGLETSANNIAVLDTYNRGEGGNGYGVVYGQTYYADVNNLNFGDLRHGLAAQLEGSSAFNNFHVAYSETNLDFHGGDDRGNIYYVEEMQAPVNYVLGQESRGYESFRLIDYRHEANEEYNMVVFDKVTGLETVFKTDSHAHPHFASENLIASENGAIINGGVGHDRILSGSGNDSFSGGWGRDAFYFTMHNGVDEILDFESLDTIHIITPEESELTAQDIFNTAIQRGTDVILFTAEGHEIRLAHTDIGDIAVQHIKIVHNAFDTISNARQWTDHFHGDVHHEMVDYSQSTESIHIDLEQNIAKGGWAQGDVLRDIEGIIGSDLAQARDFLYGDDNDNTFYGMDGADIFDGRGGADIIDGGAGWDTVLYTSSQKGVYVNLGTGEMRGGDAEGDQLYGVEAIVGSAHDDVLIGNGGANILRGGAGDDILSALSGNNKLFGGEGADTFILSAYNSDQYRHYTEIHDFNMAEGDRIDISYLIENEHRADAAIESFIDITHNSDGHTVVSMIDSNNVSHDLAILYNYSGSIDSSAAVAPAIIVDDSTSIM